MKLIRLESRVNPPFSSSHKRAASYEKEKFPFDMSFLHFKCNLLIFHRGIPRVNIASGGV